MGPEVILYIQIAAAIIRMLQNEDGAFDDDLEIDAVLERLPKDIKKKLGKIETSDIVDSLLILKFIGKVLGK